MALPLEDIFAKLPIPKPPPIFCFDDLATHDVKDAASLGYTDDAPLDGLKGPHKQEVYAKLFWARYLGVSDSQMVTAMGLSFHSTDDLETYNAATERLTEIVDTMRSQAFGPTGYLAKLVQHTVEMRDYEAVLFDLARNEMVFGFICTGETDSERHVREAKQAAYRDTKNEMLARLGASQDKEITKAKEVLEALQRKVRAKAADINTARKVLQHHEAQEIVWSPGLNASYESLQHMPRPKLRYGEEHDVVVQLIWEEVWTRDIGANMLWPVRDTINIPASLEANEDFYRAAWVVFASDTWRYCISVEPRSERETLQSMELVYVNLAAVHKEFFAGELGLGKLKLSETADPKAGLKRAPPSSSRSLAYGSKKKRRVAE
jgi:hypothetical protein